MKPIEEMEVLENAIEKLEEEIQNNDIVIMSLKGRIAIIKMKGLTK